MRTNAPVPSVTPGTPPASRHDGHHVLDGLPPHARPQPEYETALLALALRRTARRRLAAVVQAGAALLVVALQIDSVRQHGWNWIIAAALVALADAVYGWRLPSRALAALRNLH